MEEKLTLYIVTPEGFTFTEKVDEVTAPGVEGEFGVYPGHIHFITTLNNGLVTYKKGSISKAVQVKSGYVEVAPDRVNILADEAQVQ